MSGVTLGATTHKGPMMNEANDFLIISEYELLKYLSAYANGRVAVFIIESVFTDLVSCFRCDRHRLTHDRGQPLRYRLFNAYGHADSLETLALSRRRRGVDANLRGE